MPNMHRRKRITTLVTCVLMLASCGGAGGGDLSGLNRLPVKVIEGLVKAAEPAPPPDPPETALGWDLVVANDVVRWRECTATDSCGPIEHSRSVTDLNAVAHVGEASMGGRQVDVMKLSFPPRPRP